jgi:hypothetical protein
MCHCVVWSIDSRVLEEPAVSYIQGGGMKMEPADSSRSANLHGVTSQKGYAMSHTVPQTPITMEGHV